MNAESSVPTWEIVPLRSSHLPALRQLFLESRRTTFHWQPREKFKLHDLDDMTEGETVLVAMCGSDPVGFVAWWPEGNFVHHLFLLPSWQRRGVGRALLSACVEQIGRPARLKCVCRNENALAFYRSQGWQIEKKEPGENGEYYQLILS